MKLCLPIQCLLILEQLFVYEQFMLRFSAMLFPQGTKPVPLEKEDLVCTTF